MADRIFLLSGIAASVLAAGCATTPEPEPIPEPIEQPAPPAPLTCTPISLLEKKVTPAVVRRGFSMTSVEDAPEYYTDPETGEVREIERKSEGNLVPYEIVISPEVIYYVDAQGIVVNDICTLEELEAASAGQVAEPVTRPLVTQ